MINPPAAYKRMADDYIATAKQIKAHHASLIRPSKKSIRELDLIPTFVKMARDCNHRSLESRRWER